KRTFEMIPMCHPLLLTKASLDFELEEATHCIRVIATTKVTGQTGVEMEALHAVSCALLTIYDMVKAMDRSMQIEDIHLDKKDGGKSGLFERSVD
ncbi:MAG: cyclic pyranopterin monophosphate synthase, partial [Clostridiales bacterium]|nr:cyclic pyranopterin monophosphate synthase [Clostridiales bacterium]